MKKVITLFTACLLLLAVALSLASCGGIDRTGLWENATYNKDATVGEGEKTVTVEISDGENVITLTVKTDKANLGDALYELELINDPSFFDTLNGIKADWDNDQSYWAFYIGDDYASVGVKDAKITGGEHFKFVYTKY